MGARDGVAALEDMVWTRAMVTAEQADTGRLAVAVAMAVAVVMGQDITR